MLEYPNIKLSVVVVAFDEEKYIENCIKGIIFQSHSLFELIIVDDCSKDNTEKIIKNIDDSRILYTRNYQRKGIAASRNIGIKKATSEYIFFTDADCYPEKYWLSEGLKILKENDCLAVEGRTCYETAFTSLSDRIIENIYGGSFLTCNIGYRKNILCEVGYFNEEYKYVSEDTDLAIKVLKRGKIIFSPDMLVFHQQKKQSVVKYFKDAFRVVSKVKYIKNTHDFRACPMRIIYPAHLAYILFPPLLIFRYRIINLKELFLLPILYSSYVFERILAWLTVIREGIFII